MFFLLQQQNNFVRAPGLQKIDKLIPLCLENLCIDSDEMIINKLLIEYDKDEVEFGMNRKTFSRQISETQEDTMKKLINCYICGRSIIYVDRLDWYDSSLSNFLPVDLKFRVNSLNVYTDWEFEITHPFIDPRSFPLKTMITIPENSSFDNQIVQLAETLILHVFTHRIVTVEDLKKLNNKTVVFEYCISSIVDIIPLIKHHVETKKDIGKTFMISTKRTDDISEKLRGFELAFGEFQCDLDDVDKRYVQY